MRRIVSLDQQLLVNSLSLAFHAMERLKHFGSKSSQGARCRPSVPFLAVRRHKSFQALCDLHGDLCSKAVVQQKNLIIRI